MVVEIWGKCSFESTQYWSVVSKTHAWSLKEFVDTFPVKIKSVFTMIFKNIFHHMTLENRLLFDYVKDED